MGEASNPLDGTLVLELEGELTPYAGRVLADLGASVTFIRQPAASACGIPPAPTVGGLDGVDWFLHRGKRSASPDEVDELIAAADIVLQSHEGPGEPSVSRDRVRSVNPRAVHALLTPFGTTGPRAEHVSTDLVRLAAGGLLWLGGYPDAEPVAAFGGQSTLATGLFAAVGVLFALIERDATGEGCVVEVSAQEVMTQALETSIAEFELTGTVRVRTGDGAREAGTGTYACADGLVSMVAGRLGTASAWTRLRQWMVEEETPNAAELLASEWDELSFRQQPDSSQRFAEILDTFARNRTKQELYEGAQARRIALAPVNRLGEVLDDAQLGARAFFARDEREGIRALLPTPPFRFAGLREPDGPTTAPKPAPPVTVVASPAEWP